MPEPLRIALLTHSLNPRGGVVHTFSLAEALQSLGHAVTVFAPALPGQRPFRPLSCALEAVPVGPAPADLAAMVEDRVGALVQALARHVADRPFDVFHAQDSLGGNALATLRERGVIGGFLRTVHHLDDFEDPRVAAWQQRGFVHADAVLCVSRTWCELLRERHGIAAAQVPNGVDLARWSPRPGPADAALVRRLGLRPGAPLVLAIGGLEARKNAQRLIEAFVRLRRERPGAQLVIAGGASLLDHGGYAAACRARIALDGLTVGPGGDVLLTGPLPDADMPALMRAADVLAMVSLREGFGLVVLEALASGTPVVVSRQAPFTEYLAEHEAGWADPHAVASIAEALAAATDPARLRRAATAADGDPAAVPAVCRRHGWAASAQRHVALYRAQRALARRPRDAATAA
ncbi:MSMEG_0565 family glycosyltransferase [Piscinibacter sakaiensis]|uniref:Glycosyltransferase n=1 Tax=Piscinibacter sakaiensis TaxID=1547922 RepID=A0A0K8P0W2_PISS1|nr:MSMEG_0565 family glycosyltransferase [Piscinibacter sakaiensis]GAP36271.1 glycosyltransferase [Piscinibacter sakaiensis]